MQHLFINASCSVISSSTLHSTHLAYRSYRHTATMLHRGHRTWTPYIDPHPDKENSLHALPLKTPVRHASGSSKHHTLNGKASLLGKQAPTTGGKAVSQTVKGKEKEGGVEGVKRAPMTVFKDRNLVLTGKKNGVSERGSRDGGEGDTFGA